MNNQKNAKRNIQSKKKNKNKTKQKNTHIFLMIYAKWLIKTETLVLHNGCNI